MALLLAQFDEALANIEPSKEDKRRTHSRPISRFAAFHEEDEVLAGYGIDHGPPPPG